MSGNNIEFPEEGTFVPEGYEPQNESTGAVTVDGLRIPVVRDCANVELRKEGPSDLTRSATVTTRAEYDGTNYLSVIDHIQPCQIQLRDAINGELYTVHSGYVHSYGGAGDNPNVQFTVRSPSHLLNEIPASVSFGDATLTDVLRYVTETFSESQPIYDEMELVTWDNVGEQEALDLFNFEDSTVPAFVKTGDITALGRMPKVQSKNFTANKHNLTDVLTWARKRANFRYWIADGHTDTPKLVVVPTEDNERLHTHFQARESHSESAERKVDVLENNALAEMSPPNTLTVKGGAIRSREGQVLRQGTDRFYTELPPKKYVEVTATYPPLVDRAGGLIEGRDRTIDADSETAVENTAKSELKDLLDEDSRSGTIKVRLNPRITPYDTIELRPVHKGSVATDVDTLPYEVERVVHHTAVNTDTAPYTELGVSLHTDPTKIETEASWKEA